MNKSLPITVNIIRPVIPKGLFGSNAIVARYDNLIDPK